MRDDSGLLLGFLYYGLIPGTLAGNYINREATAISALIVTLSPIEFAAGPMIAGAVAQLTGSLQAGFVAMSLASSVGIAAGLMYPARR